ncbi:GNAT family N-acetyltransferase [Gluconobacter morbifer]|uniref:Putative acetyltransferase n=1 Tax=Gluconobacter morbifer G707 TaxID=1088869 RepID=G6XLE5_9PROT|nr:GNAT family N-acetyltransferase [Gluconobacter morbifer]EHH67200.1 putative acetyltransferase [Gluconobacter morbifer G707]
MLRERPFPSSPTARLVVEVTFLETRVPRPFPVVPDGLSLTRVDAPAIALYRRLYQEVGGEYCWWMRRPMPDAELAAILHDPDVHFMVLWDAAGESLGFYELDLRERGDANLAYFGLVPSAVGKGLGRVLLDCAVAQAFANGGWRLRVNTCSLDHPHALPNYHRAGFTVRSVVREEWDVPVDYLPERLRRL